MKNFFNKYRTPILWIASILIIIFLGLFGYGVAVFPTALPVKILVVAVLAVIAISTITLLVILIHGFLDSLF